MTSTIAAITTGGGGVVTTADASGNLSLLSGATTILAATATGVAVTGTLSATGAVTNSGTITSTGSVSAPNTFGFKNRIINGAMAIDQRNAGASVTLTTNITYTLDRWLGYLSVASKYSMQQSTTTATAFKNSLLVTSLSSYTVGAGEQFSIAQLIEGSNVYDLAWGTASAATVTLSFWVRSSLTGTFGGAIKNSAGDRAYPFSYTILSANTFEQKTITIAGDTSGTWLTTNGIGIGVVFGIGVGSTLSGTAGAWAAGNLFSATGATSVVGTNGATFYITGVQLEKGTLATSFDWRPYGTEFALCQRYFHGITSAGFAGVGFNSSTTQTNTQINLPVLMRSAPTLTAPTTYQVNYAATSTPGTGITSSIGAAGGLVGVTTAAVLTTGQCAAFTVLTGTLGLSSEL